MRRGWVVDRLAEVMGWVGLGGGWGWETDSPRIRRS